MKVKRFIGGMLESNGYFLYHKAGGKCLIIDPGYNYRTFTDFIEEYCSLTIITIMWVQWKGSERYMNVLCICIKTIAICTKSRWMYI